MWVIVCVKIGFYIFTALILESGNSYGVLELQRINSIRIKGLYRGAVYGLYIMQYRILFPVLGHSSFTQGFFQNGFCPNVVTKFSFSIS